MIRKLSAAVLTASLLFAVSAHAETVRLPESGDPAFTAQLPDGWTHELRPDGSLRAFSANHTAAIGLAIVHYSGPLEVFAARAIKSPDGMPPAAGGPAEISGYTGSAFDATLVNADDVHAKVHLVVVRLDEDYVAAATMLTAENLDTAATDAATAVLKGVTLTKVAVPPASPPPTETPATPATPTPPASAETPPAPTTP